MQVQPVRRPEAPQPPGEMADRLAGLEGNDLGEVRVVGDERGHRALRHVDQLRLGVAPGERPHQGGGEQDVADGAEAHHEDAQHGAKATAALPRFASHH